MQESTYKIKRTIYKEIIDTINNKAVAVITRARQVGKTTIYLKKKNSIIQRVHFLHGFKKRVHFKYPDI
ncbi:MAG: hypothetical protein IJ194_07285 [Bacilli bacterium]|nr:hypothetical protein [Bacilli bacterium]